MRIAFPIWVLVAAAACGCADRPRAPALTTDAVFEDARVGLRFVVPDGWVMGMRAVPPPGPLAAPTRLVRYQSTTPDRAADLELLAIDLAESTDIAQYLADYHAAGKKWTAGPTEPLTVNGVSGSRYEYSAAAQQGFRREVSAFRRGGRVYLFMTTHGAADTDSRDQVRRAVASIVWTGS
jgi:hypothetical protein